MARQGQTPFSMKRYYDLKSFWLNRFGCKVYKLPIDAGFTCPNRDGSLSTGGCIYCDGRGSRLRAGRAKPARILAHSQRFA